MNPLGNIQVFNEPCKNDALSGLFDMIDFAQTFRSPQAFMQSLQLQNPGLYQYLVQLSQQIRNPMQMASEMLMQRGISPDQLAALMHRR